MMLLCCRFCSICCDEQRKINTSLHHVANGKRRRMLRSSVTSRIKQLLDATRHASKAIAHEKWNWNKTESSVVGWNKTNFCFSFVSVLFQFHFTCASGLSNDLLPVALERNRQPETDVAIFCKCSCYGVNFQISRNLNYTVPNLNLKISSKVYTKIARAVMLWTVLLGVTKSGDTGFYFSITLASVHWF